MRPSDGLAKGAKVIFDTLPEFTYLSTGVAYRVINVDRRSIHLFRVDGSSGSSETRLMLDRATFRFLD